MSGARADAAEGHGLMPRPSFFLVGAPKCGTTSLCDYLRQHPDIFIPSTKEPHFFDLDVSFPRICSDQNEYIDMFACTNKPVTGEGTTWYLYSKVAAKEIHDFNPDARIIIAIRNPVDMVYSLFRFRRYLGGEKLERFQDVFVREKEDKPYTDDSYIYTSVAKYYAQVKRYMDRFGQDGVHVVIFDDLEKDPETVYRCILQFLGVRDDFRPAFRVLHRTGRIRSERFQQRIAHLPPPIKRLAYAFPRAIRRPAYRTLHRLNTSYAPPPPLDPELRRRLNDEFRPDVERLSALIGRDLTHWVAE